MPKALEMAGLGWLTRELTDVPGDDRWLSVREQDALARLSVAKRRADWRLGRWAGKAALAAWLGVSPEETEIVAADDGVPEAFVRGEKAPAALSLSHRGGRALAAVAGGGSTLGCDLEAVEPRSPAFVREWLGADEAMRLAQLEGERRDLAANLSWSAREAAAKALRGGLRLNVRRARVSHAGIAEHSGDWEPLRVVWAGGPVEHGWWRAEPGWVLTVVCDPSAEARPRRLG